MDKFYKTDIENFVIRDARPDDTGLILDFIKDLAQYEKMSDQVTATEEILYDSLFVKHQAGVIIGEYNGQAAAFALYFHNFSTFLGKANLYLEDLLVRQQQRGLGLGKAMLKCLAAIACERGCERLDWWCLDWNESSVEFYKSMGAKPMSDWTVYRLEGKNLIDLSQK
jgi:GNAT superfamily N-acetyltransferase